ncbi:hypothetical protein PMNALOAF_1330 [Methylobacterium adhaesivum]|jgi:hypothetical protein|uniref:Uncharacterized protein n=1 Tax=Methylobacterium adhaesivum TaxID=333297 RepID=A0ABT8BHG0_9HYPH|nr:hypothetical protein [Methylobacterium adhaesivum]MDN3591313.1 hypothetical protein [Methylobacterium adhaesivum]GJD30086.1 hypothetical protein PMNALOAF_1330 [Methylobacterium adhaesivum]
MARNGHETSPLTARNARNRLHERAEIILLGLTSVLGLLWAIVLVTRFHVPLSGFGQSLWLMR